MTRVATNLAIDVLRKQGRRPSEPGPGLQPPFESDTVQRLEVVRWLRRLSRRQRQVVVLHYLGGLTDREVSEVLGLSVPTGKTHLVRGLGTLRGLNDAVWEGSDASGDPV